MELMEPLVSIVYLGTDDEVEHMLKHGGVRKFTKYAVNEKYFGLYPFCIIQGIVHVLGATNRISQFCFGLHCPYRRVYFKTFFKGKGIDTENHEN